MMRDLIDDDGRVRCPQCGNWCTHHEYVVAYDRAEDAADTLETTIADGLTRQDRVPSAQSSNPSGRRDGVAIGLWCECCPWQGELTLGQHKGMTFVSVRPGWTKNVERPPRDDC